MSTAIKDEEFIKTLSKMEILLLWKGEVKRRVKADSEIRFLKEQLNFHIKETGKYKNWYLKEKSS